MIHNRQITDCGSQAYPMLELARFFSPLAITTLLMHLTLSLFSAGLARLPSPELFIAAYAIAQSFAFMVESFVIPIRQLVPVFVNNQDSYVIIRKFIRRLILFVVLLFTLIVFSGLAEWILRRLVGVEDRILAEAMRILKMLSVFPMVVAVRNFFQGILMKSRNTPLVTAGALVRMVFVGIVVLFIDVLSPIPGGYVAGFLLLGAILVEALALFLLIRRSYGKTEHALHAIRGHATSANTDEITNKRLIRFIAPLILTAFIGSIGIFVVNSGLIRTAVPEAALATFAVGWSLGMVFVGPLNMLHQIPLNYLQADSRPRRESIKRFMTGIGVILTLILLIVSCTPLGLFLLRYYMGVSEEISRWAMDVLKIMAGIPLITVVREYYWGLFLRDHKTNYIVCGKSINLVSIGIAVSLLVGTSLPNPAIIGAFGMLAGQVAEAVYLVLLMWWKRRIP